MVDVPTYDKSKDQYPDKYFPQPNLPPFLFVLFSGHRSIITFGRVATILLEHQT